MPSLETLHDLFVYELRSLFDAENQLSKVLPSMAQAAHSEELRGVFELHLRETKEHIRWLELVFEALGTSPEGGTCKAMKGLIDETRDLLRNEADPDVRDAGLIVAAQKIEHYEIAGYGSVCTFAKAMNYSNALQQLKQTIAGEEAADKHLSDLAANVNARAETADETPHLSER